MRLCSIINSWVDSIELLPFCLKNHLQFCDHVIVVWSMTSNHKTYDDGFLPFIMKYKNDGRITFHQHEPVPGATPLVNETRKRNYGIDVARKSGFTHFIIADADEFYIPESMNYEKKKFDKGDLNGIVHPLKVYIKTPHLWCSDHTLVPGIHKLEKTTFVGQFKEYPFAYDELGNAHIDPSRRVNYLSGIGMSEFPMHHYSYVRKNIDLKIDNSSANIRRSRQVIYDELRDAKPGYISKLYHQELKETENIFGIRI
jgi:hypothetical protein